MLMLLGLVALSACSGSGFSIKTNIQNLGSQSVRIIYTGQDGGVRDEFAVAQDGRFEYEGYVGEGITIVSVFSSNNVPIFRLAVEGGDDVQVRGDFARPHCYECKGSDPSAEWMKFEHDNEEAYSANDTQTLDAAIEKYVKEHRSSVVSTLLLIADYSDLGGKGAKLLESIDEKARPQSLIDSYMALTIATEQPITQLPPMTLCGTDGQFTSLSTSTNKATVIYWWYNSGVDRHNDIVKLASLETELTPDVTFVDVSLDSDSATWHGVVSSDDTNWKHYWAPGSMLDPAVEKLHIKEMPLCIVTDSTGHQIYRGQDIDAVGKTLHKYLGR